MVNPISPVIETERLILRAPRAEDFERFAQLFADENAARFIGGHTPRAASWRRFLQMPGAWAVQGFAMFSVIDKNTGLWLGQCGPWRPDGWPGNEVGWSFHPDAWGKGYATEAANASINWVFENLDWDDVIHCIDLENVASIRLAERVGSTPRGPTKLPEPFQDASVHHWGQTREQWSQRKREATA
jgi:RimJ/RimL family protein N-acetyltransferase